MKACRVTVHCYMARVSNVGNVLEQHVSNVCAFLSSIAKSHDNYKKSLAALFVVFVTGPYN